MALRAVVFDFGMVLTADPDQGAHEMLKSITGLPHEEFERRYWADRHAYDRGDLNGVTFWQKFIRDAALDFPEESIHELNQWDARMWTTQNPRMVAWQKKLKLAGFKTAILSNMGDTVHLSIAEAFDWLKGFDVLVWSYQLNLAKPERAIYLELLNRLGTAPEETLFIDDKVENIEAARAVGIQALQFSTVEQLQKDLVTTGLDRELPQPD